MRGLGTRAARSVGLWRPVCPASGAGRPGNSAWFGRAAWSCTAWTGVVLTRGQMVLARKIRPLIALISPGGTLEIPRQLHLLSDRVVAAFCRLSWEFDALGVFSVGKSFDKSKKGARADRTSLKKEPPLRPATGSAGATRVRSEAAPGSRRQRDPHFKLVQAALFLKAEKCFYSKSHLPFRYLYVEDVCRRLAHH